MKGWKTVKLGDVSEINPKKKEVSDLDPNTKVSFLPMAKVSDQGYIIDEKEKRLHEVIKGFTYFRRGDILLAKITPCLENGKRTRTDGINNEIGFASTEFHVIRANKTIILPDFIFYLITQAKFRKLAEFRMTGSAGQKRVPTQFLKSFKIPLPPLPVQKRIVSILEKAENLKQKREATNKETQKIIQSIFYDMFGDPVKNEKGWEVGLLKDIVTIERDSIFPEDINDNEKYVGLENIESESGKILFINTVKKGEIKSSKFRFNKHHILYGKLRPYLNKVAFPVFQGICSTDILPISPKKDFSNREFIGHLLKLPHYIRLATNQSTGANLPRISPKNIENFEVVKPPLSLQQEFAKRVQLIESIQSKQQQSTQEINTLFDALMQKAFKGELA